MPTRDGGVTATIDGRAATTIAAAPVRAGLFFRSAGALLALVIIAAGCPRHLPVARPHPAPTAEELARVLDARQRAIVSMNARVRATSWLGGDRVRATVLMLVHRGGSLRFEAEISLQGTVAVLATDGRQFAFLDAMRNELRRGPACPANVASLVRIPLAPADVAAILLGDARLPDGVDPAKGVVDWDSARAADVLAVKRQDGWLRFLFQGKGGTLKLVGAIAAGPDGRPRWRVSFDDLTSVTPAGAGAAPVTLPGTIHFAEGDGAFDEGVEIKFKERTINEPAADDAFVLRPPAGATQIDVGCPRSPVAPVVP